MNFPTEQLRLYVINCQKTGAATKDIFHEMTQVYGKDNVPSQNVVYRWILIQDIQNMAWQKKGAKKLRAVKPKLTLRKKMLVAAFTCSVAHPRFSITALPKSKTIDSEYMIKFFQETIGIDSATFERILQCLTTWFYEWTMLDPIVTILLLLHSNI